jgi:hypothetical protein
MNKEILPVIYKKNISSNFIRNSEKSFTSIIVHFILRPIKIIYKNYDTTDVFYTQ